VTSQGPRGARRGFATSGSFLIVFIGLFIALGTIYTVTANTGERLGDAQEDQRERHRAVQTTGVTVTDATWSTGDANLTVTVENTGDTTLSVSAADTVVDGRYVAVDDYERVEVAGVDTDVWRPGETLVLEDDDTVTGFATTPDRVRFVTETGVADASEVAAA